jgi:hypothetical protein
LAQKYAELVSNNPPPLIGFTVARTRRAATKKKITKADRRQYEDMRDAANWIADKLNYQIGSKDRADFVFMEIQRLLDGTFTPDYWLSCRIESSQYFESAPLNVDAPTGKLIRYKRPKNVVYSSTIPVEKARVYSFVQSDNRPSHTTYPDGTPSISPSVYIGQTIGEVFKDIQWRWRKTVFKLATSYPAAELPPVFLKSDCRIDAVGNYRGSRGMFAMVYKALFIDRSSTARTDNSAPLRPSWSSYWRYKIPTTGGIPYQTSLQRKIVMLAKRVFKSEAAPTFEAAIVKSGVRPLQGIGYNNNHYVRTETTENLQLWQVKPCLTRGQTLEFIESGYVVIPSTLGAVTILKDRAFFVANMYSVTSAADRSIAHPVTGDVASINPINTGGTVDASQVNQLHLTNWYSNSFTIHADNATAPLYFTDKKGPDAARFYMGGNVMGPDPLLNREFPTDQDADNIYTFCAAMVDSGGRSGSLQITAECRYFYSLRTIVIAAECTIKYTIGEAGNGPIHQEFFPTWDVVATRAARIAEINAIADAWPNMVYWHQDGIPDYYCQLHREDETPPAGWSVVATLPRYSGYFDNMPNYIRWYAGFNMAAVLPWWHSGTGPVVATFDLSTGFGDLYMFMELAPRNETSTCPAYSFAADDWTREEFATIICDEPVKAVP